MKSCCVSICSKEYMNRYKVHKESLEKYIPEFEHILYKYEDFSEYNYKDVAQFICSVRPKVVLELFQKGYDRVLFLGADVVFFNKPHLIINSSDTLVFPHFISPLPDDGCFPNNEGVYKTGLIGSDIILWQQTENNVLFLQWQAKQLETKCIVSDGIFYDQTWLNFLPIMSDTTHDKISIIHDKAYNVAYYNLHERKLRLDGNNWNVNGFPLICFQFSGFDVNNISVHQNRYRAEGDIKKLMEWYEKKIVNDI